MSTTLVVNPRDDAPFVALAERLAADGVRTPDELQARLRQEYPDAVVRARELDGEAVTIWYVYRDGHWVSYRGEAKRRLRVSELENDLRATAEDIAADAARLAAIEEEKARLGTDDPRLLELSAEGEAIARRLVPKTVAESELAAAALATDGGAD